MSRAKQLIKIVETGEPDQDYDKETYDAICKGLKGFKCSHREFDKYQGVYITASKGGRTAKIWTVDGYAVGEVDPKSRSGGTFSYKGDPDQVLVLWIEGTDEEEKYEVRVTPAGEADTSELKAGLDHYFKGKK